MVGINRGRCQVLAYELANGSKIGKIHTFVSKDVFDPSVHFALVVDPYSNDKRVIVAHCLLKNRMTATTSPALFQSVRNSRVLSVLLLGLAQE